jgi:hypothetical protein
VISVSNSSGRFELVADGLSFPTSLTFDEAGIAYVAESGLPFGGAPAGGRIWRIGSDDNRSLLIEVLHQDLCWQTMMSCHLPKEHYCVSQRM